MTELYEIFCTIFGYHNAVKLSKSNSNKSQLSLALYHHTIDPETQVLP